MAVATRGLPGVRLSATELRTLADMIPRDELERKTQREQARVVQALRDLAHKIEALPDFKLREALPIAASSVEELSRQLRP